MTNKQSLRKRVARILRKGDIFGDQVKFTVDGNETYTSVYGTLVSLVIFAILLPYTVKKFGVMLEREDTRFQ